jgi:hypothetical protein
LPVTETAFASASSTPSMRLMVDTACRLTLRKKRLTIVMSSSAQIPRHCSCLSSTV